MARRSWTAFVVALLSLVAMPSTGRLFINLAHRQVHPSNRGAVDSPGTPRLSLDHKKAKAVAFIEEQMQRYLIPGIALSVVFKNETILARGFGTKAHGQADVAVTADTMFQIGSFTKTFIALAIAKFVDDGKMQWSDPVKQHLAWFSLQDKYAEKYTTLGDLLAMNSVFGAYEGDVAWSVELFPTEYDFVRNLSIFNTTRPLRPGYAYANLNFEILGQVIQAQAKKPWADYLRDTFWHPLGMDSTVGRAADVSNVSQMSSGHLICQDNVAGPFNLLNDSIVALRPHNNYLAAGSMLSTANDLSKFSRFLLNKGDGLFASSRPISEMITGHNIQSMFAPLAPLVGYFSYKPDGEVMGAGYGFDVVGHVLYDYDYVDKGGDTIAFKTRNGWVFSQALGVVLLSNAEAVGGSGDARIILDVMRSYIMGIFLDIPETELQASFDKATHFAKSFLPPKACEAALFDAQSVKTRGLAIPDKVKQDLVGTFQGVEPFYGRVRVFQDKDHLWLQYGAYSGRLFATSDAAVLVWDVPLGGKMTSNVTVLAPDLIVVQDIQFKRA
ncbi:unnamed protein product [Aphanomyces euteiches]|uniref:Beta-lactamase-related domain-containing protein n=1 Tax=Aphanomyces euteiches TaxID=100861 RepID=A0A6G0WTH4_9STRA|nr:hypothetical protein Ae201684_011809 [Aphanomyces euteiches]KAH9089275.1 hypothetical protein Ae201684P_001478 [Aphanomyces euteiches]KAH9142522.1 hypothetical protein AeRB84_013414 [Aphanomyces euteiches]